MSAIKKKVVIVGCGYAGASAASVLDKHKDKIELTLVTKREGFLLNKFSASRSAAANGNWIPRTMIPLSNLVKNGKLVHGTVVSIDPDSKLVILENGAALPYDILLLASGSRNLSPAEPPQNVSSKAGTEAYYTQMHDALTTSKSMVIVGSGPVAIELSGEVKAFGRKDVKVTLVTRSAEPLTGPELSKSNIQAVNTFLRDEHVDVIFNDEVVSEPFPTDLVNAIPIVHTPNGVKLKSGKEVACDLLVYTVGSKLVTQFLPSKWLDPKTGEVLVDAKTLNLVGSNDVFCAGDAAKTGLTKLGYVANEAGKVAAKNILQVVAGKKPTNSLPSIPALMQISFGPKKGRTLTSMGNFGDWVTTKTKSAGLYTKMMWGQVAPGLTPPPI